MRISLLEYRIHEPVYKLTEDEIAAGGRELEVTDYRVGDRDEKLEEFIMTSWNYWTYKDRKRNDNGEWIVMNDDEPVCIYKIYQPFAFETSEQTAKKIPFNQIMNEIDDALCKYERNEEHPFYLGGMSWKQFYDVRSAWTDAENKRRRHALFGEVPEVMERPRRKKPQQSVIINTDLFDGAEEHYAAVEHWNRGKWRVIK